MQLIKLIAVLAVVFMAIGFIENYTFAVAIPKEMEIQHERIANPLQGETSAGTGQTDEPDDAPILPGDEERRN